ncbi:tetratricopeptide repeat protein [Marinicella sp. W31]|uniref:tetratricopeptide repeat protein n=1 Tax=Marinicella sp. W31 TaxID=3023713 RepID=UPI0037574DC5
MNDSENNWENLWNAFDQLINTPMDQRQVLLTHLCAENNQMREELERLLQAHHTQSSLLDETPEWHSHLQQSFEPPEQIQGFTIDRLLGSGGSGDVFLAHKQEDGFSRTVAIKFATTGRFSPYVLNSFKNELKILLELNHPNIERLYDGGITEDNVPFLVVEFIDGEHLDHYCDAHKLDLHQRLRIFLKICDAVDRIHRSLIIHRDIKTGNIMVGQNGEPKLVDFGLAKLNDADADTGHAETTYSGHMMTMAYASPEQINGASITTATDVYALGMILHYLLTGQLAYRVDPNNLAASIHTISTEVPKTASHNIKSDAVIAQVEPALKRKLSGDLEQIIAKSLAKKPERRYASAAQLADDIQRYLDYRPVQAQRDSVFYLLGKFIRRHTMGFVLSSAAVIALISLSLILFFQSNDLENSLQEVRQEQQKVLKVTTFLTDIFNNADPLGTDAEIVKVTDLLDYSSAQLDSQFNDDPVTKATLFETLGNVYLNMSQLDESEVFFDKAKQLYQQQNDIDGLVQIHLGKARLFQYQDKFPESQQELDQLYQLVDPQTLQPLTQAKIQATAAQTQYRLGQYATAKELFESALQKRLNVLGTDHKDVAGLYRSIGNVYWRLGDFDQVKIHYQKGYEINSRLFGPSHHETLKSRTSLGIMAHARADFTTALEHLNAVAEERNKRLGTNHFLTAEALNRLGAVLNEVGQYTLAEEKLNQASLIFQNLNLSESNDHAYVLNNLALIYRQTQNYEKAHSVFQRVNAIEIANLGKKHISIATSANNLGLTSADVGNFEAALTHFREAYDIFYAANGMNNVNIAFSMTNIARMYLQLDQLQEANSWVQPALELRLQKLGTDNLHYAETLVVAADIAMHQGDIENARNKLIEVIRIRQAQLPKNDRHIAEAQLLLAATLATQNQTQAALLYYCAYPILENKLGPNHYRVQNIKNNKQKYQIITNNLETAACDDLTQLETGM